jgi:hypothetical protein
MRKLVGRLFARCVDSPDASARGDAAIVESRSTHASASFPLSRTDNFVSAHHNRLDNPVVLRIKIMLTIVSYKLVFSDCPHLHPPLLPLFSYFPIFLFSLRDGDHDSDETPQTFQVQQSDLRAARKRKTNLVEVVERVEMWRIRATTLW